MGAWFRLKDTVDPDDFSPQTRPIVVALQKHGMILADNGSPWYLSGVPDPRWNDDDLNRLRSVPGSAFEAVDVSALKVSSTSYAITGAGPTTTTTVPTSTTTTVPPASGNFVTNPGFESNLTGWRAGDNATTRRPHLRRRPQRSLFRRDRPQEDDRRRRHRRLTELGERRRPPAPSTPPRHGSMRRRAAASPCGFVSTAARRWLRSQTAVVTGTGGWQQVTVQSAPAAGGTSISLDVQVSLTSTMRARIDDVSLRTL